MEQIQNLSHSNDYRAWVKDLKQRYLSEGVAELQKSLIRVFARTETAGMPSLLSFAPSASCGIIGETASLPSQCASMEHVYDFYHTYNHLLENLQQPAAESLLKELCSITGDHQCRIVAKCKKSPKKND